METLTISLKSQVVIPEAIRERLGLSPGQKVRAVVSGDRIERIPLQPAKRMRGFLKGITPGFPLSPPADERGGLEHQLCVARGAGVGRVEAGATERRDELAPGAFS